MADLRPADDLTILDDVQLFIRIFPSADVLISLGNGEYRPSTGGVKGREKDEPISVDLGSLCTAEETRDRGTDGYFHVAVLTAGAVRELGLRVTRDPIIQEAIPNPAHALVHGSRINAEDGNQTGGLTKGENSQVAHAARMLIITLQPELPA